MPHTRPLPLIATHLSQLSDLTAGLAAVPPPVRTAAPSPATLKVTEDELLHGLTGPQTDAVTHDGGPLLVVAGPGSGKTRVLTHRIARLAATHPTGRILAVTFTNKAANEMLHRVNQLVDTGNTAWISTFHSLCARFLRIEHTAAELPAGFTILDAADTAKLIRRIVTDLGYAHGPDAAKAARQYATEISAIKDHAGIDTWGGDPSDGLEDVMTEYETRLTRLAAVDFGDLLLKTLTTLQTRPDVLRKWRHRFSHILVDEYQDSNITQLHIVNLLGDHHQQITVVGDPDQSIYAWRGAAADTMGRFEQSFPHCRVVILQHNFRSTPQILEVCRSVIGPNHNPHRPALHPNQPAGPVPLLHAATDPHREANWIADRVEQLGGPRTDHAVLVRTNTQTRVLETVFAERQIPVDLIGTTRFFDRAEVKDVLAWCQLAINPGNTLAFERAVTTPRRGIGPKMVETVTAHAATTGTTVIDAARHIAAGPGRTSALRQFLTVYDEVADAAHHSPHDLASAAVHTTGIRTHWAGTENGPDRCDNLDELLNAAVEAAAADKITSDGTPVTGMPAFDQCVHWLETSALVNPAETGTGTGVQIMTVHAAKGREFPHVVVAGVEQDLFPHKFNADTPAGVAEERRLLYVACSRAQRTLAVTYSQTRIQYGAGPKRPAPAATFMSEFLDPVDPAHLQSVNPQPQFPTHRRGAQPSGLRSRTVPTNVRVGAAVTHPLFGAGVVETCTGTVATVRFGAATKTLDLSIAPITVTRV